MQHVPEKGGRSEVLGIYLIFFFQFCHIFGSFFPQEYHILFTNFHCKYDKNIIYFQHLIIKLVFLLFHSRQYCQQI